MGYKLDLSYFKIFGCIAYALIQIDHRKKFDSHSIECIFLGYNDESTWLRLMKKKTKQVIISRYVIFHEMSNKNDFPYK